MTKLFDKDLVSAEFSANFSSVVLTMTDPLSEMTLTCSGIVLLHWHRFPDESAPFIPELYWERVEGQALRKLLVRLRFSFYDDLGSAMLGQPALPPEEAVWCRFDHPLVHLHLEGDVCADIVCKRLEVRELRMEDSDEAL